MYNVKSFQTFQFILWKCFVKNFEEKENRDKTQMFVELQSNCWYISSDTKS